MPKDFWGNIAAVKKQLQTHSVLLLMLDFDGTLSPIALHPDAAFLPDKTKEILQKLKKNPNIFLAIISGRDLATLKEKVGIPDILYAGNHGLAKEIFGKTVIYELSEETRDAIKNVKEKLTKLCEKYPGSITEDKKQILVLHYRMVEKNKVADLTKEFEEIIKPYVEKNVFTVANGTLIYEVKPITDINKGVVVKELMEKIQVKTQQKPLGIYIGDDKSDEDAFKALPNGITIVVGENQQSSATYFLKNQDEVLEFLTWYNSVIP